MMQIMRRVRDPYGNPHSSASSRLKWRQGIIEQMGEPMVEQYFGTCQVWQ
jgi:hypothetical protein